MTVKLFIADDHDTVTDGLLAIFNPIADINVVGRARDGKELLQMLKHKPVDVLLMDLRMPGYSGMDALPEVRAAYPRLRIIVLSGDRSYERISAALGAGADSYLTKDADKHEIIHAVRETAAGRSYHNATASAVLRGGGTDNSTAPAPTQTTIPLTPRERTIVCLIVKELTSKEIAEQLRISHLTVERHRRNIFGKLDLKNVVGLVKYALTHDLVRDDCGSFESA